MDEKEHLLDVYIPDFTHYDGLELCNSKGNENENKNDNLQIGTKLKLTFDKEKNKDENEDKVGVYKDDKHLGYLPKENDICEVIRKMLKSGHNFFEVRVSRLNNNAETDRRLEISIWITKESVVQ
jgi:hypothetical protein